MCVYAGGPMCVFARDNVRILGGGRGGIHYFVTPIAACECAQTCVSNVVIFLSIGAVSFPFVPFVPQVGPTIALYNLGILGWR
jgi:hypothetical protein